MSSMNYQLWETDFEASSSSNKAGINKSASSSFTNSISLFVTSILFGRYT